MAETKHTPGPWRTHCDLYAEAGDNLIVAKAERSTDYKVSRANARLIAAAPELLEALEDLVAHVRHFNAAARGPLRQKVRAALTVIAKAEGRSDG